MDSCLLGGKLANATLNLYSHNNVHITELLWIAEIHSKALPPIAESRAHCFIWHGRDPYIHVLTHWGRSFRIYAYKFCLCM